MHSTTSKISATGVLFLLLLLFIGIYRFPLVKNPRIYFELAFRWTVIVMLAVFIGSHINRWAGMFLVLAFWSAQFPGLTEWSKTAFYYVMFGLIWYSIAVYLMLRHERLAGLIMDGMLIVAAASVLILVCQAFNYDPIFKPNIKALYNWDGSSPRTGLMDNRNNAAVLMAFCFAGCFRFSRLKYIPLVILGLVLAKSFGAVLSIVFACILFTFIGAKKHRYRVMICICGLLLLAAYKWVIDYPDIFHRLNVWSIGIDKWKQHWVFGGGIGHWKIVFLRLDIIKQLGDFFQGYTGPDGRPMIETARFHYAAQAHNEFVQGLFEMGIGFALIVIGYFVDVIRRFNSEAAVSAFALVVIVINCCFYFPFHIGPLALIALTWMAMLEAKLRHAGMLELINIGRLGEAKRNPTKNRFGFWLWIAFAAFLAGHTIYGILKEISLI